MQTRIDLTVERPGHGDHGDGSGGAADVHGDVAAVRLIGALDAPTAPELTERLADVLREHDRLVADVSGLDATDETAALALPAALEAAGGWPRVRLALAAPGETLATLLASSGADRRVPVHPDVTTASRHLDERPALVHDSWRFSISPRSPGTARGCVRRACEQWQVDDEVREAAEIVVTELVTNAVEHAGSSSLVEVERSAATFRLSVRDWDTGVLPDATLPPATSSRGRGLAMVAAVAHDWGVLTHPDGKTIWAEMSTA